MPSPFRARGSPQRGAWMEHTASSRRGDLCHNLLSDHVQVVDTRLHVCGQAVDGESDVLYTDLLLRPEELFDTVLGRAVDRPVVQGDIRAELQRHHSALLHAPEGIVGERFAEV